MTHQRGSVRLLSNFSRLHAIKNTLTFIRKIMAEAQDDGLLGIEVDTDDYAETAAGDTPSVPRTFQSEAEFQAQKASWSAKIDQGNIQSGLTLSGKLSKKEVQLLGYAVGEMYFDRKYQEIIDLCEKVKEGNEVDAKLRESLERWTKRCRERMG